MLAEEAQPANDDFTLTTTTISFSGPSNSAAVIRRLRETVHGLLNDLDVENVAEVDRSVGRIELATVVELHSS